MKNDIQELIASIRRELDELKRVSDADARVLEGKLAKCASDLSELTSQLDEMDANARAEYESALEEITRLKTEIEGVTSSLYSLQVGDSVGETVAVGITPKEVHDSTGDVYPIMAKYAEKDVNGDDLATTYSKVSDTLELSATLTSGLELETSARLEDVSELRVGLAKESVDRDEADRGLESQLSALESIQGVIDDRVTELEEGKQDKLTAGDGVSITENVIRHSVKIVSDDEGDTLVDTKLTVRLNNGRYKVLTLDASITDIEFVIAKTDGDVLQETGFEFTCPVDGKLEGVTFSVEGDEGVKILSITPSSYTGGNVYQGTVVNYKCTICEFETEG